MKAKYPTTFRPMTLMGALLCVFAVAPMAQAADSPMFRGGVGLSGAFTEKLSLPLSLAWKYTAEYSPYNPSSPAVVGKTVYFSDINRVYALDTETGAVKWRYPQDGPFNTVINTSPAVVDGILYYGSENGELTALDANDGHKIWAFVTRSIVNASPTVHNGAVYFGTAAGRIYGCDAKTGRELPAWKGGVQLTDEITGAPAIGNDSVYVLTLDSTLHAIGIATGKVRNAVRVNGSVLRMSPVVANEYVYVAAGSTIYYLMSRNLTARRSVPLPNDALVSPVVTEDSVYTITRDGQVYAYDSRTGRPKWKQSPKLNFDTIAAPSLSGDTLFVGTARGGVYGIDAATGDIKWTYRMQPSTSRDDAIPNSTNIAACPVIANGALYVVSDDGSLVSFRNDASDTAVPQISDLELPTGPVPNVNTPTFMAINGSPPLYFTAKLMDEGSGINAGSIKLMLDGVALPKRPATDTAKDSAAWEFDVATSLLKYRLPAPTTAAVAEALRDGRHSFTLQVSDWAGNVLNKTWMFTVDNSLKALPRKTATRNPNNPMGSGGRPGAGGGKGGDNP